MGLVSTLIEGIRMATDSLVANKVRSGLTILGIAIGVIVVMVMAAVVEGVNSSFKDVIASAGPNTFYVLHAMQSGFSDSSDEEESALANTTDSAAKLSMEGVAGASLSW